MNPRSSVIPSFFSADNRTLGNLFRTLSRHGVLRLGGSSSELTFWQSAGTESRAVEQSAATFGHKFSITPKAIENLADFLKATDWKLIYGLNLAGGDLASAVEEAAHVSKDRW